MITKKHRINLVILLKHLQKLEAPSNSFNMRWFWKSSVGYVGCDDTEENYLEERSIGNIHLSQFYNTNPTCGTSACMLGHGVLAGVRVPKGCYDWSDYADKFVEDYDSLSGKYLFGFHWCNYDNTVEGAIDRIKDYLDVDGDMGELKIPWMRESLFDTLLREERDEQN